MNGITYPVDEDPKSKSKIEQVNELYVKSKGERISELLAMCTCPEYAIEACEHCSEACDIAHFGD